MVRLIKPLTCPAVLFILTIMSCISQKGLLSPLLRWFNHSMQGAFTFGTQLLFLYFCKLAIFIFGIKDFQSDNESFPVVSNGTQCRNLLSKRPTFISAVDILKWKEILKMQRDICLLNPVKWIEQPNIILPKDSMNETSPMISLAGESVQCFHFGHVTRPFGMSSFPLNASKVSNISEFQHIYLQSVSCGSLDLFWYI